MDQRQITLPYNSLTSTNHPQEQCLHNLLSNSKTRAGHNPTLHFSRSSDP